MPPQPPRSYSGPWQAQELKSQTYAKQKSRLQPRSMNGKPLREATSDQGSKPADLSAAYRVKEAPQGLMRVLPKQRPPVVVWRDFDRETSDKFTDANLELAGLTDYIGCSTQEMPMRPIPHTFYESEVHSMITLFAKWEPIILRWVFKQLRPPTQAYNRKTRLGYPFFEIRPDKLSVLLPEFARLLDRNFDVLKGSYTINNIRLQPESKTKERVFRFISPEGRVFEREISAEERTRFGRVSSRTRLVFNQPISNLLKQILDSAIHNVFMRHPAYHHDMTTIAGKREAGYTYALDVSHFERHVGACVRMRADLIGGLYKDLALQNLAAPFLVVATDWKTPFFVWPNTKAGSIEQLGSGDSAVAPIGKEVLTCVFAEFLTRALNVDQDQAIDTVARGGIPGRFEIKNYGDDNFLSGDKVLIHEFVSFASGFLDVSREEPARFLGWIYDDENGWHLALKSYVLNMVLPERQPGSRFRQNVELGVVKRREIYSRYGTTELREIYIPKEKGLWLKFGIREEELQMEAARQESAALRSPMMLSTNMILDKQYLLSDADKAALPELYGVVGPRYTTPVIRQLVGEQWQEFLP
jgi:hypothetical protein